LCGLLFVEVTWKWSFAIMKRKQSSFENDNYFSESFPLDSRMDASQLGEPTEAFYDALAQSYRFIYEDWDRSVIRQAEVLTKLLGSYKVEAPALVLDVACGIGTQAIGLAAKGFLVSGSDISGASIECAKREAEKRGLSVNFSKQDMLNISDERPEWKGKFAAVLAADNAIPHLLTDDAVLQTFQSVRTRDIGWHFSFIDLLLCEGSCRPSTRWYLPCVHSGL
jgi:SAM-dependent methyltransferase